MNTATENKTNEEYLSEHFKELNAAEMKNSENFEKHILTISTAVLGFSITFLSQKLPNGHEEILHLSWYALLLTSCLSTVTYLIRGKAIEREAERVAKYYADPAKEEYPARSGNCYVNGIAIINIIVTILFVFGIFLSVLFASKSIADDSKKVEPTVINKINETTQAEQMANTDSGNGPKKDKDIKENSIGIPLVRPLMPKPEPPKATNIKIEKQPNSKPSKP